MGDNNATETHGCFHICNVSLQNHGAIFRWWTSCKVIPSILVSLGNIISDQACFAEGGNIIRGWNVTTNLKLHLYSPFLCKDGDKKNLILSLVLMKHDHPVVQKPLVPPTAWPGWHKNTHLYWHSHKSSSHTKTHFSLPPSLLSWGCYSICPSPISLIVLLVGHVSSGRCLMAV